VTELDLRQSFIPTSLIEHLADVMPRNVAGDGYDYQAFLDGLVKGNVSNGIKTRSENHKSVDWRRGNGGMARRSRHYL
jgi:Ca2+ insensitive EF hand